MRKEKKLEIKLTDIDFHYFHRAKEIMWKLSKICNLKVCGQMIGSGPKMEFEYWLYGTKKDCITYETIAKILHKDATIESNIKDYERPEYLRKYDKIHEKEDRKFERKMDIEKLEECIELLTGILIDKYKEAEKS